MATEFLEETKLLADQMMRQGASSHNVLAYLVKAAEAINGKNAVCSILVIDHEGLLRNGASPGLPDDYLAAIDRIKPDENLGTCAAAAATGKLVLTPDFMADSKWAELRHLPLALGFVGAWSLPIKDTSGKVLGTFGTYLRESRLPSEEEVNTVRSLALVAAGVLKETRSLRQNGR